MRWPFGRQRYHLHVHQVDRSRLREASGQTYIGICRQFGVVAGWLRARLPHPIEF